MDRIASYSTAIIIGIGLFSILGGMLFRKTFSVIRNIVISPLMGFSLALMAFVPQSATELIQHAYNVTRGLIGSDLTAIASEIPSILVSLGLKVAESKWFFLTGSILSAILLGTAIALPIRSSFQMKSGTLVVSSFVLTLCLFIGFSAFGRNSSSILFLSIFGGLSALLLILQNYDFDFIIIVETSLIGTLLVLSPIQVKYNLNYIVFLLFTVLVCSIFILVALMIRGRQNGKKH